ncbi:MAG: AraC family transcriptional regulator [Oscillospiraceae bacterium]|nr:AraC family transcriptional regulator [Oscillospiraceae bacterium]
MVIEGLHEKKIFDRNFPFRFLVNKDINFSYPQHWHNALEIIYVIKNNFVVMVNSRRYELKEQDILYIPGGDVHEFCNETPTGKRLFFNFEVSSLNSYVDIDRLYTQLRDVRLITPQDKDLYSAIEGQIRKIIKEWQKEEPMDELYYTARMLDILVLLCRTSASHIMMETRGKNDNGLEKISKSLKFIEKYYTEDIHLNDIARAAGFSQYYFSRLFKEITEKNFRQYLNEYRIKKAETLLISPEHTVSETAYAVGFSSISTFDRLFRQIKGCSPKEFRCLHIGL